MKFKDLKIGDKFYINDNPKDQFEKIKKINNDRNWNTKWVTNFPDSICNIPTDYDVVLLNPKMKFCDLPEGSLFKLVTGIKGHSEGETFLKVKKNPFDDDYMIEHDAVWVTKIPGFNCYFPPETLVEKQNGNS